MIAQFVEAPDWMQRTLQVPEEIRQQCASHQCQSLHWETVGNNTATTPQGNSEEGKEKGSGKELHAEDETGFMFQSDKIESWWDKAVNFLTSLFMF